MTKILNIASLSLQRLLLLLPISEKKEQQTLISQLCLSKHREELFTAPVWTQSLHEALSILF